MSILNLIEEELSSNLIISKRVQARRILQIIREPNDDMLNAARDWSAKKYGKPIGNDSAIGCFQVMIDRALKDEKT